MDQDRSVPIYDLYIHPLRKAPDLTSLIVQGVKSTLACMLEEPFAVHDISAAIMEIVDNIQRHADWSSACQPALHIWLEVMDKKPYFTIMASNAVHRSEETCAKIQHLAEQTRDREVALATVARALSGILPLTGGKQQNGGMGLLNIAALERCRMSICLSGDIFEIQVALALPEYSRWAEG